MVAGLAIAIFYAFQLDANSEPGLRDAIRRSPQSFEANYRLGHLLLGQNRLKDAIPYLETAYRAQPSHEANTYDLGLAYLRSGAVDQARRHVQTAVARKETGSLRNLEGAIEAKGENVTRAAEAFRRAVELDPSEPHIFDLGDYFVRYSGFADAVKIFSYGLERYPRSARMHVGLGIARYSLGEYDAAVDSLCRAVDLDPADPRPLTFLGLVHDVSSSLAGEVSRRLQGFVERFPQNAQANYFYALSLWKRSADRTAGAEIEAAEKHLRAAVTHDPELAPAHYQLGVLLEDTKRAGEAIAAYSRAVRFDPSLSKAHYRLAKLYARMGNTTASERHLRVFKRLQTAQPK